MPEAKYDSINSPVSIGKPSSYTLAESAFLIVSLLAYMDFTVSSATCKWCSINLSQIEFEDVQLCNDCHQKAVSAAKNPTLCNRCETILTDQDAIKELFSEYGLHHYRAAELRLQAENGCELCRMFLLQDPNTDPGRLQFVPLFLMGRRPDGIENIQNSDSSSAGDINSFFFSSETDQFSLELSVSACDGEQKDALIQISNVYFELGIGSFR